MKALKTADICGTNPYIWVTSILVRYNNENRHYHHWTLRIYTRTCQTSIYFLNTKSLRKPWCNLMSATAKNDKWTLLLKNKVFRISKSDRDTDHGCLRYKCCWKRIVCYVLQLGTKQQHLWSIEHMLLEYILDDLLIMYYTNKDRNFHSSINTNFLFYRITQKQEWLEMMGLLINTLMQQVEEDIVLFLSLGVSSFYFVSIFLYC